MELDGEPVVAPVGLGPTGYGHFTTMRVESYRVRGLSGHLDRLARDARVMFSTALDTDRIRALVRRVCDGPPVLVRVTVFDPGGDPWQPGAGRPRILVGTRPVPPPGPPLRLRCATYRRELPVVKHLGLAPALYERRAAQLAGFDDAVFVDRAGRICEGPTWNIGFLAGDTLVWPRGDKLPGITAGLLDLAAPAVGLRTAQRDLARTELPEVRAAFVTSASVGLRPVAAVDSVPLRADEPELAALAAAYEAIEGDEL